MDQQPTILEIPLFPLGTVLFPGMPLPLHIFEERYKRMIARCLAGGREFGIVLIRSGREVSEDPTPYEIGTVARIVKSVEMADGRYNIVTEGVSRFQILESSREEAGYLTARVELLGEEEHDVHRLAGLQAAVRDGFERFIGQLAEVTGGRVESINFPPDPTALSYFVASYLPIYQWEKQRLLEATSTDVRLVEERRILARERTLLREFVMPVAPYEGGRIAISLN